MWVSFLFCCWCLFCFVFYFGWEIGNVPMYVTQENIITTVYAMILFVFDSTWCQGRPAQWRKSYQTKWRRKSARKIVERWKMGNFQVQFAGKVEMTATNSHVVPYLDIGWAWFGIFLACSWNFLHFCRRNNIRTCKKGIRLNCESYEIIENVRKVFDIDMCN